LVEKSQNKLVPHLSPHLFQDVAKLLANNTTHIQHMHELFKQELMHLGYVISGQ
jgi:hypothetical protein